MDQRYISDNMAAFLLRLRMECPINHGVRALISLYTFPTVRVSSCNDPTRFVQYLTCCSRHWSTVSIVVGELTIVDIDLKVATLGNDGDDSACTWGYREARGSLLWSPGPMSPGCQITVQNKNLHWCTCKE